MGEGGSGLKDVGVRVKNEGHQTLTSILPRALVGVRSSGSLHQGGGRVTWYHAQAPLRFDMPTTYRLTNVFASRVLGLATSLINVIGDGSMTNAQAHG